MEKRSSLLVPLILIAVGIAFICLFAQAGFMIWLMILLGVALIVPSVFNMIWIMIRRHRAGGTREVNDTSSFIGSIIALGLGIWIVCMPATFARFTTVVFAIFLFIEAIGDVVVMVRDARPKRLSAYYYIVPGLMVAAGVVLLCTPLRGIDAMVVLVTGIALTLSGVNRLIEYIAKR